MPFHFVRQLQSAEAVIEILRPQSSRITFAPPPVIKESPVPKPEEEEPSPQVPLHVLREDPVPEDSVEPSLEETPGAWRNLEWLPWVLGVLVALGILGSAGYWVIDRFSTRSAIAETNRLEPPKPP